MLHNTSKGWITGAWLVAVFAVLWTVAGSVSVTVLTGITIVSLVPLVILRILARDPQQTTTESIRAVLTGRGR